MAAPPIFSPQYMSYEVRKLVQQMGLYANNGLVQPMEKLSGEINDLMTLPGFPPNDADSYRNIIECYYLYAFKRRVNVAMGEVMALRRGLVVENLDDLLDQVWRHVSGAEQYGAEPGYRRRIEDWLKSIMETPFDQLSERLPGQLGGIGRVGSNVNRRRSRRFSSPPLTVVIYGQILTTIDWSPFGLCVKDLCRCYSVNTKIKCTIRSSVNSCDKPEQARVVRFDERGSAMALEFYNISYVVLALMHEFRKAGVPFEGAP